MLTKAKLLKRIKEIEGEDFEVKRAKNSVPKESWKTVSAFSNTNGGYLIFGVEQIADNEFQVSGINNPEKIQNDFLNTLRGGKFNLPLIARPKLIKINKLKVMAFYVSPQPRQAKPIYYDNINNSYIRTGSSDQKATREEIERMLREASLSSSDSMVLEKLTFNDLREDTITRYFEINKELNSGNEMGRLNKEELFLKMGIIRKDKKKIKFTVASVLLFGKDEIINNYFPYYKIDYLEIPGTQWGGVNGKRYEYRILSEENLFETFWNIIKRLRTRVPNPFSFADEGLIRNDESLPLIVIREAFINLLVHTDYFDRKCGVIKVYDDRFELLNGGALLFDIKKIDEGYISEPRNPLIIKAFRNIKLAENLGLGLLSIINDWNKSGFKPVKIESNLRKNHFMIDLSTIVVSAEKEEAQVEVQVPSKYPASTQQVPRKHPPSTPQAPPKHPPSTPQVKKVLDFCLNEKSREEIQEYLGLINRKYVRNSIIMPLLESELLAMTIPGKPSSPKQKYVITEAGKALLKRLKKR